MIGLGQLTTIGNCPTRAHEMRLFQEVAQVDEKEAEQGALHSDVLRLASKDQETEGLFSRKGITHRLSKFWLDLKSKKVPAEENEESDCPVAQARAQSVVGANAPMGWLTFDHLGEETEAAGKETFSTAANSSPSSESTSLSFLQPDPEDTDFIFGGEWFLSPCG